MNNRRLTVHDLLSALKAAYPKRTLRFVINHDESCQIVDLEPHPEVSEKHGATQKFDSLDDLTEWLDLDL